MISNDIRLKLIQKGVKSMESVRHNSMIRFLISGLLILISLAAGIGIWTALPDDGKSAGGCVIVVLFLIVLVLLVTWMSQPYERLKNLALDQSLVTHFNRSLKFATAT
jgi:membrane protein YdbS with pleckstrin-like domain